MKKINIIRKNDEYTRIINNIKPYKHKDLIVYLEQTIDQTYHFGFSVGKKIGNAVTRNKIKRQIKTTLDKKNYQNNFNCIIMVRKGIVDKNFIDIEIMLFEILDKINIIKGETNE